MTDKFVQMAKRTNKTLTADATHGDLYDETARAGVVLETGVTGDVVPVTFEGRFTLAKNNNAFTAGQKVYSDGSVVTGSASGNTALGVAVAAAATGDATAIVDLGMW